MSELSNYGIKGLKTFRGREGYGFNATLTRDGKKVALAYDDASGGMMRVEWVSKEEAEAFHAIVRRMPNREFDGTTISVDTDMAIDDLVQYELHAKDLAKATKGKLAFIKEGALYTVKPRPTETVEELVERAKRTMPHVKVLNDLPKTEAVALLKLLD